jgi:hypothetical protein
MSVKTTEESREALREAEERLRELELSLEQVRAWLGAWDIAENAQTVGELAARSGVSEEALRAFATTAGELLGGAALGEAEARRAAMVAAARVVWERELGPLLSGAQVRELLGGVSRQRVDELVRGRRLISLRERSGRRRYPLFQFEDGRPLEPIVKAFYTVSEGLDDWSAASWCVHREPALADLSPVQWAKAGKERERLTRVARQDAARLAQ